jgi:hypothetical protein
LPAVVVRRQRGKRTIWTINEVDDSCSLIKEAAINTRKKIKKTVIKETDY